MDTERSGCGKQARPSGWRFLDNRERGEANETFCHTRRVLLGLVECQTLSEKHTSTLEIVQMQAGVS